MTSSRVAVTGIGLVTTLGADARTTVASWLAGESAARGSIPELQASGVPDAEARLLPDFDAAARLGKDRRMIRFMSDASVLGCLAAREATAQAGTQGRFAADRIGLYAGAGLTGARVREALPMAEASIGADGEFSLALMGEAGLAATNPLLSFKVLANMPPCLVSILEGIQGPNLVLGPWEGQTAAALEEAWRAVAEGEVDCAVADGADSASHPATALYLRQAGLLAPGEYPSPGAAYLVLEREEAARVAGKRVLATIKELTVATTDAPACDPLGPRLGRTFAAAPAILLALAVLTGQSQCACNGADRVAMRAKIGAAS